MARRTTVTTLILLAIIAALIVAAYFYTTSQIQATKKPESSPISTQAAVPIKPRPIRSGIQALAFSHFLDTFGGGQTANNFQLVEPIADFENRITKKTFGLYITPETSPVHPDHFTGYHTGVDAEFEDSQEEIPVRAIAEGTIVVRKWLSGYGGAVAIKHTINGVTVFAIYGHLDPDSFPSDDIVKVKAGQVIGILGDDHSHETDGVRKHLHFSIFAGDKLDMRGYVPTEEELLANWLNPLDFY